MKIDDEVNQRLTPVFKQILCKNKGANPRVRYWNYRAAIGMLNYLQDSPRSEKVMSVHQYARFSIDPRITHEKAVTGIGDYLLGTRDRDIKFTSYKSRANKCFVDANFAGSWDKADAEILDNELSRTV